MNLAAAALVGAGDTIAAEATRSGRGALAVIRVSGPQCHAVCRHIVASWPTAPRRATLSRLIDRRLALLDTGIVVRYDAPASFTGENAVEITTHGGAVVPTSVLAALVDAGARIAQPGEFTRRAVLNGKLDLLQAEAIGDLVTAASRGAQRLALSQLDGGLSRRLLALRDELIGVEALIAYDIDFPEEDDGPISRDRVLGAVDELRVSLAHLLATSDAGEAVRDGALVVLAGPPNAGKSSLFNALVGRRRAIVTDMPGTTRDAIEAVLDIGRWPIRLVDTAGLRDANEPVERIGVEVSYEYLGRASLVIACGASDADVDRVITTCDGLTPGAVVGVRTKADLDVRDQSEDRFIAVSALTGLGLETLSAAIVTALDARLGITETDAPLLTRTRHRTRVAKAREELELFRAAWWDQQVPAVVAAVHLRAASAALEELIGRIDVENVLDEVFARFCVGK